MLRQLAIWKNVAVTFSALWSTLELVLLVKVVCIVVNDFVKLLSERLEVMSLKCELEVGVIGVGITSITSDDDGTHDGGLTWHLLLAGETTHVGPHFGSRVQVFQLLKRI